MKDQFKDQIDSFFLVRIFNLHVFKPFFSSFCSKLTGRTLQAATQFSNLNDNYNPQVNNQEYAKLVQLYPQASIGKRIFKKYLLFKIINATILSIISGLLVFTGPILIQQILKFITNQQQDKVLPISLVCAFVFLYLLRIFTTEYAKRLFFQIAVESEQIMQFQIYNKILKLAAANNVQKQQLIHTVNSDSNSDQLVKTVVAFINEGLNIVSSPFVLITDLIILFIYLELYAFVWLFLMVIGILGQHFIGRRLIDERQKKAEVFQDRYKRNLNFFQYIKQIKSFYWQDLILQKNQQMRNEENNYTYNWSVLYNTFLMLVHIIPSFSAAIIFSMQILIEGTDNFSSIYVFIHLSFLNLTIQPMKSGLNRTKLLFDAKSSLNDIEQILVMCVNQQKEDFHPIADDIEEGYCQAKNAKLSWQFDKKKSTKYDQTNQNIHQNKVSIQNPLGIILKPQSQFYVKLNITFQKGKRYLIGGEIQSGKSSILHAFLGNMNKIQGSIKLNGKIAYCPQIPWFSNQSIRQNILFGHQFNQKWYQKVIKAVNLKTDIEVWQDEDMTLMTDNRITTGQRKKVAICRAIYSQSDIYFFDNSLNGLDSIIKKEVYQNAICQLLKDKTVVMVINQYSYIKQDDIILEIENGEIAKRLNFKDVYQERGGRWMQKRKEARKLKEYQKKKLMPKMMSRLFTVATKQNGKQVGMEQQFFRVIMQQQNQRVSKQRPQGVELKYYWKLLSQPNFIQVLIAILIVCLLQSTKVFMDYYIGAFNNLTFYDGSINSKLLIYGGLNILYLLTWVCIFVFNPVIASGKTQLLSKNCLQKLCHTKLEYFNNKSNAGIVGKICKDNQPIFMLFINLKSILMGIVFYIATTIIVSITNIYFLIPAILVLLVNYLILHIFLKAQRQYAIAGQPYNAQINNIIQQAANGVDVIRASKRVQSYLQKATKRIYKSTVAKANLRYLYHAMNILTQITVLILIASTCFIVIFQKATTSISQIPLLGLSIVFSLKLTGSISSIITNSARAQITMRSVKATYKLQEQLPEQQQVIENLPQNWPQYGEIQLKNVSLKYSKDGPLVINNISSVIKQFEYCAIFGGTASGKSSLLQGLCKMIQVEQNTDGSIGDILIDKVSIKNISRKTLSENMIILTEYPFVFRGSVRENIDPFQHYTDQQIIQTTKKTGLYKDLDLNPVLAFMDQGSAKLKAKVQIQNIGEGFKQLINISRALLINPKIILMDQAVSQVDKAKIQFIENIIQVDFQPNTVVMATHQFRVATFADKIIILQNGNILEEGIPKQLIDKQEGQFSNMVRKYSIDLYQQLQRTVTVKTREKKLKSKKTLQQMKKT